MERRFRCKSCGGKIFGRQIETGICGECTVDLVVVEDYIRRQAYPEVVIDTVGKNAHELAGEMKAAGWGSDNSNVSIRMPEGMAGDIEALTVWFDTISEAAREAQL